MPELIPQSTSTVGSETIQTVNARDLHAFLTVGTDFRHWILRRIDAYHFEEDRDFTTVTSAQRPVRTIEYHVSLDMALNKTHR